LAKEELLVELTLGDNIPAASLWPLGFHMALHFIVAINMATTGFLVVASRSEPTKIL